MVLRKKRQKIQEKMLLRAELEVEEAAVRNKIVSEVESETKQE